MTAIETVMLVANIVALATVGIFIAAYSRVRWWVTPTGQNVMAVAVVIVALLTVGVLRRFDAPATDPLVLIAHVATSITMAWRTALLWQAQHPHDPDDQED
ncbi:hypothetical protein [Micrococcus sp. IITD107]|uniref:putative phage holin n=1 Tax=Micrococcus sp. IITD107 TaxID=3342790 RepID=UPI0035B96448